MAVYNKFILSSGHGAKVEGACGNGYKEHAEATKVMKKVADYLKKGGCTVTCFEDTTSKNQNANLKWLVGKHNAIKEGIDVSIHFNSSNNHSSTGTEVLYYSKSKAMKTKAAELSKAISTVLGIKDRGAKTGDNLYFLNSTKKEAILIEVCFISNKSDMTKYKNSFDKLCLSIARSLCGRDITKAIKKSSTVSIASDNKVSIASDSCGVEKAEKKYYLYSGTFTKQESVKKVVAELQKMMKIVRIRQEGEKYRIITGTFASLESANKMVKIIKDKFDLDFTPKEG